MRRLLAMLSMLVLGACSHQPTFTYDVRPDAPVATFHTAAFDPRALAWLIEGQRPVQAESLKQQVRAGLEARGYRWVEPEAAELWVDVVALRPDKGGGSPGSGRSEHEGRGGGHSGGGMRGGKGAGRDHGGSGSEGKGFMQGGTVFPDLDPRQDLTITVQLLAKEHTQILWTGTLFRPGQKKSNPDGSNGHLPDLVEQLLGPVPPSRAKASQ